MIENISVRRVQKIINILQTSKTKCETSNRQRFPFDSENKQSAGASTISVNTQQNFHKIQIPLTVIDFKGNNL